MIVDGKTYDPALLEQELATAGVPINGLGADLVPGTFDTFTNLHTFDQNGQPIPLPPEADPIVAAHVPKADQVVARQQRINAEAEAQAQLLALGNPDYLVLLAGGSVGSH